MAKTDFANIIKMERLSSIVWVGPIKSSLKGGRKVRVREGDVTMESDQREEKTLYCWLQKWKKESQAKVCMLALESGKGREMILHKSLQKESVLLTTHQ